ncbi:copper amine oxidase N-terminal domain-containing protein [Paenibacillus apiarius]|uniref:Copper amine oxidase N-terminal domain-containing protein n=1 Tax=Paenibacillus apiarius TaxID=46240 RepID=A0ABT4DX29_9BACL|nr:copper amine oxidase N-terminal domain-containing protein [Paenibacillus apiarius]MCY9513769.1 copper amine oxidase N-terminal domain-containing protein [Paenibacillus apiarius]MCY9520531.1 copper amine oxidase N-terminal domain-containing protein [Paenibacillus apiarius]MCY9550664.1 copper amine oxidase N-terminal domain-containing protein [Paenibacillus apiarius]MCY9559185.1 copper amine oxidase N-terminal domain-containing protein [Paenibacillus apiarius]MCY9683020.1 copper amine oxidase
MDNNRLFVPIRALASLGLSYSFNPTTKVTTVQNKDGDYLKISANSRTAYKNGKVIQMDIPAQNRNGRILVPIRFVSESLGYNVQFESIRKFVFVNSKDYSFDSKLLYQDDLQAARKAAIALPINADFKTLGTLDGYRLHQYTFPAGRADTYYFDDGIYTFVQVKDGKAIAIGQLFRERRVPSQAAGNVLPEMSLDTDPIMEAYAHRSVIFFENNDGTATTGYNDDKNKSVHMKTKMNIYSDIIQKLPDHR